MSRLRAAARGHAGNRKCVPAGDASAADARCACTAAAGSAYTVVASSLVGQTVATDDASQQVGWRGMSEAAMQHIKPGRFAVLQPAEALGSVLSLWTPSPHGWQSG